MKTTRKAFDKYALYKASVQDPANDVKLYQGFFAKLRGRPARSLREDFCGTFALSCEWVKAGPRQTALGLDLDPEPLAYGRANYLPELLEDQRTRLKIFRKNVMTVTKPVDLIVAGNFSFCIFTERAELLRYFKACRKSLKAGRGALILDVAGGPGMLEEGRDRRKIRMPGGAGRRFTYEWETRGFDPITHSVRYAIHFELPDGRRLRNAFTYDWRHWTIPEIRDLMAEAGFRESVVFWDVSKDDRYERLAIRDRGENIDCFVAYVAGLA